MLKKYLPSLPTCPFEKYFLIENVAEGDAFNTYVFNNGMKFLLLEKGFHSNVASLLTNRLTTAHYSGRGIHALHIFASLLFFLSSSRNEWTEESVYDIPNDPGELPSAGPVLERRAL